MAFPLPDLETGPFRSVSARIQQEMDAVKESGHTQRHDPPGEHEVRFGMLTAYQKAVQILAQVEKELMGGKAK